MSYGDVIISLTYLKNEEKLHLRLGNTSIGELIIDFSKTTGGEARALLAASVAECMGSWLLHFLKRHKEKLSNFRIVAKTHSSISGGENIMDKITLEIHVKIIGSKENREKYEKIIRRILSKGCLISRTLEKGVKIEYVPVIEGQEI